MKLFHPLIQSWFDNRFEQVTDAQALGWPAILEGKDTLIAAPTGSGKTLAAFLSCLDRLIREGLSGHLRSEIQVIYISPLKALGNDIQRNLEDPLAEIQALAIETKQALPKIRVAVRTGDTPQAERRKMLNLPPHILITTPESLYLLLTADASRNLLRSVHTVIVDEIHAVARDKRGAHLSLSLERLEELCVKRPLRIGLSATQKPMSDIAAFLVGNSKKNEDKKRDCSIIDVGHLRELDLAIESPTSSLSAVCSNAQWEEVYKQIATLIQNHRSTLVFVNTRRFAERITHHLSALLGEENITSHHGSLSKKSRLSAEKRLKAGQLKAVVATASLELGIDIGHIDLVIQIGSPRAIATFLQRIGRSGHALGLVPKGRIVALTRDELLEAIALIRAIREKRLDRIQIPEGPTDILAQQIVAMCAAEEWEEAALFDCIKRAYPYRDLSVERFEAVLEMLSEGIQSSNGRKGAHLYRNREEKRLKARRGARLTALTSGGAIPDLADYRVVAEPDNITVGSVDEDFAVESLAGDVFLLGNTSWRIQQVKAGEIRVHDAQGAAPTIPFWRGEAPSRTTELSQEVSTLREEIENRLGDEKAAATWLQQEAVLSDQNAADCVNYIATQKAAVGMIPSDSHLLFERFFDESGGMQLVIHAPLGGRVNRAWGLALRKRFCRRFDFELQASADDNGLVLSLGPQQGFNLEEIVNWIPPEGAIEMLEQALLPSPFFTNRWRWNTTRALVVPRRMSGKKVPPPLQRFRADDLLTNIFPALTACPDNGNFVGNLDLPEHPLLRQTVDDVLHEAMDAPAWLSLLQDLASKKVEVTCIDTREPSPFSYQLLNAQPYAFLDDAPLEERRARAVATRRSLSVESLRDLGKLDPEAIKKVQQEAWPLIRDEDELHDHLLAICLLPEREAQATAPALIFENNHSEWKSWFEKLLKKNRACRIEDARGRPYWIASERWPLIKNTGLNFFIDKEPKLLPGIKTDWESHEALLALIRARVELIGPTTANALAETLGLQVPQTLTFLEALESDGIVLRGRFTQHTDKQPPEFCARHLLARIHRLTLNALRAQIAPISTAHLMLFLFEWQHLTPATQRRGSESLLEIISQLQGFEMPAVAWEKDILSKRIAQYQSAWLDEQCHSGALSWGRVALSKTKTASRILPLSLMLREDLSWLRSKTLAEPELRFDRLSGNAQALLDILKQSGALFFSELQSRTKLLTTELEQTLWELVAAGYINCDGFAAIRALTKTKKKASPQLQQRAKRFWGGRLPAPQTANKGRWALMANGEDETEESHTTDKQDADHLRWAWQLLNRYGVFFRDLLTRESAAPPWRILLPLYRRMEARGEIRGGRFITGVSGEQFVLPEALPLLRQKRLQAQTKFIQLSACDPLNLIGILDDHPKVTASASNTLIYLNGSVVAYRQGKIRWMSPNLSEKMQVEVEQTLR